MASPLSQDPVKFQLKVSNLTWHRPSPLISVLDVRVAMSCTMERTSSLMLMVMDSAFNLQSKIDCLPLVWLFFLGKFFFFLFTTIILNGSRQIWLDVGTYMRNSLGLEWLPAAVGRGRLRRHQRAPAAPRQGVEARHRVVQQVSEYERTTRYFSIPTNNIFLMEGE